MIAEKSAMRSGDELMARAAAAGITSIATISKTPMTLIATATTRAKQTVKMRCSRLGFIPEA